MVTTERRSVLQRIHIYSPFERHPKVETRAELPAAEVLAPLRGNTKHIYGAPGVNVMFTTNETCPSPCTFTGIGAFAKLAAERNTRDLTMRVAFAEHLLPPKSDAVQRAGYIFWLFVATTEALHLAAKLASTALADYDSIRIEIDAGPLEGEARSAYNRITYFKSIKPLTPDSIPPMCMTGVEVSAQAILSIRDEHIATIVRGFNRISPTAASPSFSLVIPFLDILETRVGRGAMTEKGRADWERTPASIPAPLPLVTLDELLDETYPTRLLVHGRADFGGYHQQEFDIDGDPSFLASPRVTVRVPLEEEEEEEE